MTDDNKIKEIASEVTDEYGQSDQFTERYMKFYENALQNNLGGTSLERLIDSVELPEGDEMNES